MKRIFLLAIVMMSILLSRAQEVTADWNSINHRGYPQWFSDAKLGIFIHWGLYSVPAYASKEGYAEWYYRGLMVGDSARVGFHTRHYGEDFSYQDFDELFKPIFFDADEWADLFARAGARYVLLVAKHHDGYCLWNSSYAPGWNSVDGGPQRDIVAELTHAVRDHGMKMGFYYSLPEWTNDLHRWTLDPHDSITRYVEEHMIPQFKELVGRYKPSLVFADGEWFNSAEQWHAAELIAWYYNLVGEEAVVNDRWGHGANHGFRTPEYSAGITDTVRPWAECRGLGRSFGLNRNETLSNYLTSDELIRHFVKLVAAGGGMTLNVGPAADGRIPLLQQERLMQLGEWLKTNGEAIYDTRPAPRRYEMKPVEVTRVDSIVCFDWVRNSPDPLISYDDFYARWQGVLIPTRSDDYTLEVEVDDNVKVVVDGKVIIDYNPEKADAPESNAEESVNYREATANIALRAGKCYPIEILYEEKNVAATMKLFWSSKTIERTPIDAFYVDEHKSQRGLNATYSCVQPSVAYTQNDDALYAIALDFPQDSLVLEVSKPCQEAQIVMLGCDKILPWHYDEGKLIIDTRSLLYNDIRSTAAWVFRIPKNKRGE